MNEFQGERLEKDQQALQATLGKLLEVARKRQIRFVAVAVRSNFGGAPLLKWANGDWQQVNVQPAGGQYIAWTGDNTQQSPLLDWWLSVHRGYGNGGLFDLQTSKWITSWGKWAVGA
jgi:hypothetical protein